MRRAATTREFVFATRAALASIAALTIGTALFVLMASATTGGRIRGFSLLGLAVLKISTRLLWFFALGLAWVAMGYRSTCPEPKPRLPVVATALSVASLGFAILAVLRLEGIWRF